jgi:predicted TIM-barrel fold metal-dependent hydrolase
MSLPMPAVGDEEGARTPEGYDVVDFHVHLFPPRVYEAIWRWFETNAWPIRYPLYADETVEFLSARGVSRMVGLHYSHVPEMARVLNRFAAEVAMRHANVDAFGTVLPGEANAEAIVEEAFALGLKGLKLHCHVQQFAADDARLDPVYRLAARHKKPVLIHAGREPALPAYKGDIQALCSVGAMRRVLERHPDLTVVVPHLGADEIPEYGELLDAFPGLWLDTTMMLADFFPQQPPDDFIERYAHRLLYGSDFPNLPYAWDRELKKLTGLGLPDDKLTAILSGNALALLDG